MFLNILIYCYYWHLWCYSFVEISDISDDVSDAVSLDISSGVDNWCWHLTIDILVLIGTFDSDNY